MRFKFLMMVFILFSLALLPSRGVLALNGTVTTQPDQNRQSSDTTSASPKNSNQLNQEPLPTPTVSEGTIQDNTTAIKRVFLPAVFNPQTSFYVATYGSDSIRGQSIDLGAHSRKQPILWLQGIHSKSFLAPTTKQLLQRTQGPQVPISPIRPIQAR